MSISLVATLLLAHFLLALSASADSTVAYPEHVDHPELYVLPAPEKKNIDLMVNLKPHVTEGQLLNRLRTNNSRARLVLDLSPRASAPKVQNRLANGIPTGCARRYPA